MDELIKHRCLTGQYSFGSFSGPMYYYFSKLISYVSSSYYGIGGISGSIGMKSLRKL